MSHPTPNSFYSQNTGTGTTTPFIEVFKDRPPGVTDTNYLVQQRWWDTANNSEWILIGFTTIGGNLIPDWQQISFSGTAIQTLTGNVGGPVPPIAGNINTIGDGTILTVTGNPLTATLEVDLTGIVPPSNGGTGVSNPTGHGVAIGEGASPFHFIPMTSGQVLIGSTGADPVAATLTPGANITITNGPGSITIASTGGGGSTTYTEDSGSATPALGNLNIFGGTGITTSGAGSTVTIATSGVVATSYVENSGTAVPAGGVLNVLGSGGINTTGAGDTITITPGSTIATAYDGNVGSATPLTNILNIVGSGAISTSAAGNTVTINPSGTIATSYVEDAGTAVPSAGVLHIVGGAGITTSGAGNTVTITATGGGGVISTIDGDTGSITGATVTIFANNASRNCGSSVEFVNSGTVSTMNVTDANANTMIGEGSGGAALSGTNNTALGGGSCNALSTGSSNTGIGELALNNLSTGNNNTAIGQSSMSSTSNSISDNTCLGAFTGNQLSGSQNVIIGSQAAITSGGLSRDIAIGYGAGSLWGVGPQTDNIAINNQGVNAESNTLRIGSGTGTGSFQLNRAFVAGINGVTVSNTKFVTINSVTDQLGVATSIPGSITWTTTSTNVANMTVGTGYFCVSPGGALTLGLPAVSSLGDTIEVSLDGATSWQITQAAGQQIRLGSTTTTLGAGGSLTSTAQGDSIQIVCRVANTLWVAQSSIGNITVV